MATRNSRIHRPRRLLPNAIGPAAQQVQRGPLLVEGIVRNSGGTPADYESSDPETYSLRTFARTHQMSLSRLYELFDMGFGPLVTRNGRRRIITREAAAEWRRQWNGKDLPSRPKRPNEPN